MSALAELLQKRDKSQQKYDELVTPILAEKRDLTPEEDERRTKLVTKLTELDSRIDEEAAKAERSKKLAEARQLAGLAVAPDARVTSEPKTYGEGSPHSYYMDLARLAVPACASHGAASHRMSRHSFEMAREAHLGTELGRSAERQMREVTRSENEMEHRSAMASFREVGEAEFRAPLTTGGGATASASGGSAAAMVAPFVIADYVPFREPGRATADSLTRRPLPDYGMNLYIPNVTSAASVASQTEGSGVSETDPAFGFISNSIITEAGQVTVSQQALDRAGPGFAMDQVLADALRRDLAPKVDLYCLQQILANAGSIVNNTTPFKVTATSATGGLYGMVSNGKQAIRTASGVFLDANVAIMQPIRWELLAGAADANGRPFVLPDAMGPFQSVANAAGTGGAGGAGIESNGRTGYTFNTLPVMQDFNIPAPVSGADQVIVADTSVILLYEGAPINRAVPQTLAQNLQVLIQLYEYLTVLVLYPTAVQKLSGAFFQTPVFTG